MYNKNYYSIEVIDAYLNTQEQKILLRIRYDGIDRFKAIRDYEIHNRYESILLHKGFSINV